MTARDISHKGKVMDSEIAVEMLTVNFLILH